MDKFKSDKGNRISYLTKTIATFRKFILVCRN